ncbi:MAG: hypothetical protein HRT64_04000 [Erythrobacter sp.]|nr:hypothetical protein [Erythrobacter sp.]
MSDILAKLTLCIGVALIMSFFMIVKGDYQFMHLLGGSAERLKVREVDPRQVYRKNCDIRFDVMATLGFVAIMVSIVPLAAGHFSAYPTGALGVVLFFVGLFGKMKADLRAEAEIKAMAASDESD